MPRTVLIIGALMVASGLAATSVAAAAGPPSATRIAQQVRTGGEYVVAFKGTAADARAAIRDAGGTVLDVNEAIGVALVASSYSAFLSEIRTSTVVTGVTRNHAVGTVRPGMPHRYAEERPEFAGPPIAFHQGVAALSKVQATTVKKEEPLNGLQWDMQMIGANANGAHRKATGRTVLVGVIDTGVDASHPDIAPNFDKKRSRNFTTDIPAIDGPCEYPSCIDPPDVDDGGHGTHVAGTIAARKNNLGIAGVAPNAKIVNVRAGQDSGYFFLYETVAALTYAGDAGLDVVNMSFYTDPWLFNCDSADDYLSGVGDAGAARRAGADRSSSSRRRSSTRTTTASRWSPRPATTTSNLALPTRTDLSSPDYPSGTAAGAPSSRTSVPSCRRRART